jgi:hypothetical protein
MSGYLRNPNANNPTSVPAPTSAGFVVSTREKNDRSSDGGQRGQTDPLPNNGYDERGLFRTPVRFPRQVSDDRGDRSGVRSEAELARPVQGSDQRGSDSDFCACGHTKGSHHNGLGCCLIGQFSWCECEQFRNPSAGDIVRSAVLEPIPNHLNRPHYSLTVQLVIGSVIFLAMGTGLLLVLNGWGR